MKNTLIVSLLFGFLILSAQAQKPQKMGDFVESMSYKKTDKKERKLQYTPDGTDFVCINGKNKFTRALYGSHTGFRLETSDVPEFALYLPRMGGNITFYITKGNDTIALNNAKRIEARYRAGTRIYSISDPFLGKGKIMIQALALYDCEGAIWKISSENIPEKIQLICQFGGASNTRFSREGDMGADPPDCFDLKPEYCIGNLYSIENNKFKLIFGKDNTEKLYGIFPEKSILTTDKLPVLFSSVSLNDEQFFYIGKETNFSEKDLKEKFTEVENHQQKLASQVQINTPDPYFNTIGGALSVAADGIWDGQVWLHGAVGWRMPLPGWRAAYTGDFLGWHNRAKMHLNAYAASQVINVEQMYPHPMQDTAFNYARSVKVWGTPQYSNGYICRNPNRNDQMHHYDMNLAYMDELLWHLNWTGDLEYAHKIWNTIKLSLAWEKANYDPDNDGLYDAYACIWASDALYYNSGAVTHSSAYNYRANKIAAEIAEKIGENSETYRLEAEKILTAVNQTLWLQDKGHWAEYKDFMGLKRIHQSAAVWSIYHAIDGGIGNSFQNYQAIQYVNNEIPRIPVKAKGLKDENNETISTSNWLPYSWSINNVAFAEIMNTSLAYFQAGQNENGFKLLKSSVLDGMYLGASPGNFGQISHYDAARGECYRDFGDPIGVASRVFVQGLFGINPDAMNKKLVIKPGFPQKWNFADIKTPDISFSYKRNKNSTDTENFVISHQLEEIDTIELQIPARKNRVDNLTINGKSAEYKLIETSIEKPMISVRMLCSKNSPQEIKVEWKGNPLQVKTIFLKKILEKNEFISYKSKHKINEVYDPQKILEKVSHSDFQVKGKLNSKSGNHTFFTKVESGDMEWWTAVNFNIKEEKSREISDFTIVRTEKCTPIDLSEYYNSKVTDIFQNQYLSPRSPYTTLQIPTQGIGEWCHPKLTAIINDSVMRSKITNGVLSTSLGVLFKTPQTGKNIIFTSLWDNYPDSLKIPLAGKASNIYLLMAGSTNHMQCHIANGEIQINYTDGTSEKLELINPETWCPIEQDYYVDNLAFKHKNKRPYRLHFKSGIVSNNLEKDLGIKGVYGREIDGGAGMLLSLPLNPAKELSNLTLKTLSNDVVIGIMSITLQKP